MADLKAFRDGINLLLDYQKLRTRRERPRGPDRDKAVNAIVNYAGLRGDLREDYFRKLAHSALAGEERMYANWKTEAKITGRTGKGPGQHRPAMPKLDEKAVARVSGTLSKFRRHSGYKGSTGVGSLPKKRDD